MDAAWPASAGEAIHTSTFLGHPVGCGMALAQMAEIQRLGLVERSARLGQLLLRELAAVYAERITFHPRGLGLMAGLELCRPDGSPAAQESIELIKRMLGCGFILLPEGEHGNVISFTPPLTITEAQIKRTVRVLNGALTADSRA
jgi:4-aminobutyrate aminotransferase-like enzyme